MITCDNIPGKPQGVHQYQGGQWDVITIPMASSWCPSMWPLCQIVIKLPTTSEKSHTPEMDEETTFFQANHPVSRDGTIYIYVYTCIHTHTHTHMQIYGNIWKYMCVCVCVCVLHYVVHTCPKILVYSINHLIIGLPNDLTYTCMYHIYIHNIQYTIYNILYIINNKQYIYIL